MIRLLLVVLSVQFAFAAEFRAARSVHLGYSGFEGDLFYNECVVEKSVVGSYFMVCGWDTGYFGTNIAIDAFLFEEPFFYFYVESVRLFLSTSRSKHLCELCIDSYIFAYCTYYITLC